MSQTAAYPEHAPESFYDRLADEPWSPESIPDADEEIPADAIYSRVRSMSHDERREISGDALISHAAEYLLHEAVYGVRFRGPINLSFKRDGSELTEVRLSVSNNPHGGYGEDAHRAFRSFPFTAGAYREKYAEMLQTYDDNRKSERKIQETKTRIQNRIENVEAEIAERAHAHPDVPEEKVDWAETHGELARMDLADGARLSKIKPDERGRGVTLTVKRMDPEFAFLLLSILQEGQGELLSLLARLDRALSSCGEDAKLERLMDFFYDGYR